VAPYDQHEVRLDASGATFKCEIPRFAWHGCLQFEVDGDKPVSHYLGVCHYERLLTESHPPLELGAPHKS